MFVFVLGSLFSSFLGVILGEGEFVDIYVMDNAQLCGFVFIKIVKVINHYIR